MLTENRISSLQKSDLKYERLKKIIEALEGPVSELCHIPDLATFTKIYSLPEIIGFAFARGQINKEQHRELIDLCAQKMGLRGKYGNTEPGDGQRYSLNLIRLAVGEAIIISALEKSDEAAIEKLMEESEELMDKWRRASDGSPMEVSDFFVQAREKEAGARRLKEGDKQAMALQRVNGLIERAEDLIEKRQAMLSKVHMIIAAVLSLITLGIGVVVGKKIFGDTRPKYVFVNGGNGDGSGDSDGFTERKEGRSVRAVQEHGEKVKKYKKLPLFGDRAGKGRDFVLSELKQWGYEVRPANVVNGLRVYYVINPNNGETFKISDFEIKTEGKGSRFVLGEVVK